MRRVTVFGAAFAAAIVLVGSSASAQALRNNTGPAEIPPASYSGSQYVDSKGCVFIRAGVGGGTQWVPRVRRDRTVICGQRPTGGASAPAAVAAAPAPAPAPAPRVVAQAARPAAVAAAPRVVRTQPVQQQVVVRAQPAPRAVVQAAPAATATQRCAFLSANGGCAQTTWNNRFAGGQSGPVTANPTVAGSYVGTTTQRVVVSRDVTHGTNSATAYRSTWDDGRLNPTRGLKGTVAGRTGAVSSATWQTWYPPRPSVSTRSTPSYAAAAPVQRATPVRSSAGSGHRFVQVGTFGVASNAQRAARRLQGMGLPVRVQASGRYQVVLIGPYSGRGNLQTALNSARRAGFGDAFTRR